MNGCYKYINLLWNLILYYDYGMNSCVSYAEADGCTLDVLPTHPLGMLRWIQSKMTVKKGGWHISRQVPKLMVEKHPLLATEFHSPQMYTQ